MIHRTLDAIAAEIDQLIADGTPEHPVDTFSLMIVARKLRAQAEMLEQRLEA